MFSASISNTPGSCVRAPEYVHDLSVSVTLGAPSPPPPQLEARMSTASNIAPRPRFDIPCGTSHTCADLVNMLTTVTPRFARALLLPPDRGSHISVWRRCPYRPKAGARPRVTAGQPLVRCRLADEVVV